MDKNRNEEGDTAEDSGPRSTLQSPEDGRISAAIAIAKERPILFSGPMVRAILEGRKTQTRRIVKLTPGGNWMFRAAQTAVDPSVEWMRGVMCHEGPYGRPGDRLWVRETHAIWHRYIPNIDDPEFPIERGAHYRATHDEAKTIAGRWRPSIHMPRWASRINLEVVGIRVERLNDISEADAKAEGVGPMCLTCGEDCTPLGCGMCQVRYKASYACLWESMNGPGSWDANPWVWVVEFSCVSDGKGANAVSGAQHGTPEQRDGEAGTPNSRSKP